jgi:hypothetical protein
MMIIPNVIVNPSYLIRQNNPANTNDNNINFFRSLKKSASDDTTIKIKNGSVIPVNEFAIILGSNIKNKGAINANSFFTNLFAKK